jgi:superfamily II DNA/RNA helicase
VSIDTGNGASDDGDGPDLATDAGFGHDIAQVRAKAALVELLGAGDHQVTAINWRYEPVRVVRNAAALHHGLTTRARGGQLFEPLTSGNARGALTSARLWEGIAGLEDHARRPIALLTASVDYELAGYQANASCLARRARRSVEGRHGEALVRLVGTFIERRFILLRELASAASEPPESLADGLDAVREAAAVALTAQGLAAVGAFFLSGDDSRLDQGHEWLELALAGFSEGGDAAAASVLGGLVSLMPVMTSRSTWRRLAPLVQGDPRWERYVKALARGLGPSIRTARSISELWPSQLRALDDGLLEESRNKVIRMPTSAGKTRVAELAMVHELVKQPGTRCLYIAPYRALAAEVERSLDEVMGELGLTATALLGGLEDLGIEESLAARDQVIVCTPEKADLLLRVAPDLMASISMVVLDEGQVIADATRGIAYDLLVTRLRRHLPDARFLFLSAVVPDETLRDFATWLHAEDRDIITSQWRPAVQRLARFEWRAGRGTLRYIGGELEADLAQFLPGVVTQQAFEYVNEETGRINRRRFPEADNKGQLAAALAYEFVRTGPVLIFSAQTNWAESAGKALLARLDLAQLAGEPHLELVHPRATAADVAAEWLGEAHTATKLLRAGIGVHHGRLPEAVRGAVEDDMRAGRLKVLAATSTLAQGVNLPVRTVIIHSVWRSDTEGQRERISAREYWNIAGRAGRAVHETDGLVVHITTSEQDGRDFSHFAESRDSVELVVGATTALLRDLMHERISNEEAAEQLDAELLAVLVEESSAVDGELDARIERIIGESFGAAQARRREVSVNPLTNVAVQAARRIRNATPSWERLKVFAQTGLSSRSCESLVRSVDASPQLGSLLVEDVPAENVLTFELEILLAVPEMQPTASYGGSYAQLLQLWLQGFGMPEIVREMEGDTEAIEETARFIEDLAGYRLPWGISALNQIAVAALNLETLSAVATALPGMVKYGVPTPASAWLVGYGIHSRSAAIALAARAAEDRSIMSPGDLNAWLALQKADTLGPEMSLAGPTLRNLAAAIHRARRRLSGEVAETLERLSDGVVVDVPPTGAAAEAFSDLETPTVASLHRDYSSVLDRNLIDVQVQGLVFGQLPQAVSDVLALEIDTGTQVGATVVAAEVVDGRRQLHLRLEL